MGRQQQLWGKARSGNLGNIGQGELDSDSADSEDIYDFGDLGDGLDWNYFTDWEPYLDGKKYACGWWERKLRN